MVRSSAPPFTFYGASDFRADGVWVITLTLAYRDGYPPPHDPLLAQGRMVLLRALLAHGSRGRDRGAESVLVVLDEGRGEVVELDPAGVMGRFVRQ